MIRICICILNHSDKNVISPEKSDITLWRTVCPSKRSANAVFKSAIFDLSALINKVERSIVSLQLTHCIKKINSMCVSKACCKTWSGVWSLFWSGVWSQFWSGVWSQILNSILLI